MRPLLDFGLEPQIVRQLQTEAEQLKTDNLLLLEGMPKGGLDKPQTKLPDDEGSTRNE